ncbi:Transmembrane protein [Pseudomonas jessenii]
MAPDDRWSRQGLFICRIAVYCAAFGRLRPAIIRTIKPRILRGLLFFDAPAGAQREEARR